VVVRQARGREIYALALGTVPRDGPLRGGELHRGRFPRRDGARCPEERPSREGRAAPRHDPAERRRPRERHRGRQELPARDGLPRQRQRVI
jgi:hypothetical protein